MKPPLFARPFSKALVAGSSRPERSTLLSTSKGPRPQDGRYTKTRGTSAKRAVSFLAYQRTPAEKNSPLLSEDGKVAIIEEYDLPEG
jgi:hypothetical protein